MIYTTFGTFYADSKKWIVDKNVTIEKCTHAEVIESRRKEVRSARKPI